ncbi:MAG TPA: hypothetical protein VL100_06555 [Croceibacterium sp.]|nr:hypothetical protein [Croceibacterium sp.]
MRRPLRLSLALAAAPALLLAGCGQPDRQKPTQEGDPALTGALGDEIMVDPDLAGENQANSAIAAGSRSAALPPLEMTPEAIAAARSAAVKLLGGAAALKQAPEAKNVEGGLPKDATLSAAARAAASPGGSGNCADKAEYTMAWADRLPAAFPVYPRGAVQEAAGTDAAGCALRVVNFQTGVPLDEVIDFYFSSARKAGYSAQRVRDGGDDILGGIKGAASYVVYARRLPSGATDVDLVINGG